MDTVLDHSHDCDCVLVRVMEGVLVVLTSRVGDLLTVAVLENVAERDADFSSEDVIEGDHVLDIESVKVAVGVGNGGVVYRVLVTLKSRVKVLETDAENEADCERVVVVEAVPDTDFVTENSLDDVGELLGVGIGVTDVIEIVTDRDCELCLELLPDCVISFEKEIVDDAVGENV